MFIFVDFFNAFQALWSICSSIVACIDGCVYVHAGDSSMYTCICSRALKCICSYMLIQIASRVHVCLRACIHAYVLAHCGTYIHVFKRAYVHRESSRIHTRARTYGHLCSHTYKHMHMHTQVHACAHMSKCTDVRSCKESDAFWNTMKSETAVWGHSPGSFPKQLCCKGF